MKRKLCKTCGKRKPIGEFYKARNARDGLQHECKRCSLERLNKKRADLFAAGELTYNQAVRMRLKYEVISAYSDNKRVCACCGESNLEFLSIDHVNGGGRQHKKVIGGDLYGYLKRNGFPSGYRVLCFNCNFSLGHYGYCPHHAKGPYGSRPENRKKRSLQANIERVVAAIDRLLAKGVAEPKPPAIADEAGIHRNSIYLYLRKLAEQGDSLGILISRARQTG